MNKKYLIIMITACVVCLGAGLVIGMGLKESNLSATGVSQTIVIEDSINAADDAKADNFAAMALSGMESELQTVAQKIQMNQRKIQANITLAEICKIISKGSLVMTKDVYSSLRDMIAAGKDDEVYGAIYRGLRELTLSFKPGDTLSVAEWKAIAAKVEDILNNIGDASDY